MKKLLVGFVLICLLASCRENKEDKLSIAVAANMQFAMRELVDAFTASSGTACDLVISSSGKLTAQIREGAPYDVFVSADLKYPNELYRQGLTTSMPEIYAFGRLVIWTMQSDQKLFLESLTNPEIKHIAIANPSMAPYGSAAMEVLEKHGLAKPLGTKMVYGESIAQTNQFIVSGAAEIGITSKSSVLSSNMAGKGSWIDVDQADHSPIAQGMVILKRDESKLGPAIEFRDYLFSEAGGKILLKYGYVLKKNKP